MVISGITTTLLLQLHCQQSQVEYGQLPDPSFPCEGAGWRD